MVRRWVRRLFRLIAGLVLLWAVLASALALLLHHLDHPRVKRRVQALVREAASVELDYGRTQMQGLSGLRITDLVVLSPPRFRGEAPEGVRIGELEVTWSTASLLARRLRYLTLRDVRLTLVRDEDGALSLAELGAKGDGRPAPPVPLSHLLGELLRTRPPVLRLTIERAEATLLLHRKNQGVERLHLAGLGLKMTAERSGEGWRLHVRGGATGAPLAVSFSRSLPGQVAREAEAHLWLSGTASGAAVEAKVDLRLLRQTLAPAIHVAHLVHAEASAHFNRKTGRTHLTVEHTALADGALTVDASVEVPDAPDAPAVVRRAHGELDAVRLLRLVPAAWVKGKADQAHLRYDLADLEMGHLPRLAADGHVDIEGTLKAIHAPLPPIDVKVGHGRFTLKAHMRPHGDAPLRLDLDAPLSGVQVADGAGKMLLSGDPHLSAHLAEIRPDLAEPKRTRAEAKITLELGPARAHLDARKQEDRIDFDAGVEASSLALVRAFAGDASVPWEQMALSLQTKGAIEHLEAEAPRITHKTEIRLDRPAWPGKATATGLSLSLSSSGTARRHKGEADLRVRGLSVDGQSLGDTHLFLAVNFDLDAPSLRVQIVSDAQARPQMAVMAALQFDRARKSLSYDVDLRLSRLAALRPFLSRVHAIRGLDLSTLDLSFAGRGKVSGLLSGIGADGRPRLVSHPLLTLGAEGSVDVRVLGLSLAFGDALVRTPALSWHGELHTAEEQRSLHGALQLDDLHLESGERELDLKGVHDSLDVTAQGDLSLGQVAVTQRLGLGALRQDFLPGYAVGDVTLSLSASRDREGVVSISGLQMNNAAGGTGLSLSGRMDLGEERRILSLSGTIDQQLQRLWTDKRTYGGRGSLSLQLQVDSGNFSLFHTVAAMRVADGHVALPRTGLSIDGFDGELPINVDLLVDRRGVHLMRGGPPNAYSRLRYADQHPLLSSRSFISVGHIVTPLVTIDGLAANLKIEHHLVSLNQLEMGVRGGQVTGQCLIDWSEEDALFQLRVRGTHIRASTGERFDGNAAVMISARERSLDGRAEILRIGRRHLLDLLDLHDPHRSDPTVNRIRSALALGYPDRVSLVFDHGFASARVALGGLGGLLRIHELRGIPMGPIIDKVLPQAADTEDEP